MRRRLLALDLDGTLLRRDGSVDPRDRAAIRRARAEGVTVVLATGRLVGGTLPTARHLELDGSMVCGDGATIASATTGEVLDARAVDRATTERIVGMLLEHGLQPFVFSHGEIHAEERAKDLDPWVRIWSERIHWHPRLADTDAWRTEGDVAMTLGLGHDPAVGNALDALDRELGPKHVTHRLVFGDRHMLRSIRAECSKGFALGRVSQKLGVAKEDCACVGDWFNDLSMFEWASRSFAMGGAPPDVAKAATDRLENPAGTGGGVAEAIDRWLR
ncbi:MAG: HAD hydrolase family protein [Polyangiales bacterium]